MALHVSADGLLSVHGKEDSTSPPTPEDQDEGEGAFHLLPKSSPRLPRRSSNDDLEAGSGTEPTSPLIPTSPSIGSPRRRVSFADNFGLELTAVKFYDEAEVPEVPEAILDPLRDETDDDVMRRLTLRFRSCDVMSATTNSTSPISPPSTCKGHLFLKPNFDVPSSRSDLLAEVLANQVALESVAVEEEDSLCVRILMRVHNICYQKTVFVRRTFDGWASFYDLLAEYVLDSNDGATDQFAFRLSLPPPLALEGTAMEFAVRFETPFGSFWANNGQKNYSLVCCWADDVDGIGAATTPAAEEESADKNLRSCLKTKSWEPSPETLQAEAIADDMKMNDLGNSDPLHPSNLKPSSSMENFVPLQLMVTSPTGEEKVLGGGNENNRELRLQVGGQEGTHAESPADTGEIKKLEKRSRFSRNKRIAALCKKMKDEGGMHPFCHISLDDVEGIDNNDDSSSEATSPAANFEADSENNNVLDNAGSMMHQDADSLNDNLATSKDAADVVEQSADADQNKDPDRATRNETGTAQRCVKLAKMTEVEVSTVQTVVRSELPVATKLDDDRSRVLVQNDEKVGGEAAASGDGPSSSSERGAEGSAEGLMSTSRQEPATDFNMNMPTDGDTAFESMVVVPPLATSRPSENAYSHYESYEDLRIGDEAETTANPGECVDDSPTSLGVDEGWDVVGNRAAGADLPGATAAGRSEKDVHLNYSKDDANEALEAQAELDVCDEPQSPVNVDVHVVAAAERAPVTECDVSVQTEDASLYEEVLPEDLKGSEYLTEVASMPLQAFEVANVSYSTRLHEHRAPTEHSECELDAADAVVQHAEEALADFGRNSNELQHDSILYVHVGGQLEESLRPEEPVGMDISCDDVQFGEELAPPCAYVLSKEDALGEYESVQEMHETSEDDSRTPTNVSQEHSPEVCQGNEMAKGHTETHLNQVSEDSWGDHEIVEETPAVESSTEGLLLDSSDGKARAAPEAETVGGFSCTLSDAAPLGHERAGAAVAAEERETAVKQTLSIQETPWVADRPPLQKELWVGGVTQGVIVKSSPVSAQELDEGSECVPARGMHADREHEVSAEGLAGIAYPVDKQVQELLESSEMICSEPRLLESSEMICSEPRLLERSEMICSEPRLLESSEMICSEIICSEPLLVESSEMICLEPLLMESSEMICSDMICSESRLVESSEMIFSEPHVQLQDNPLFAAVPPKPSQKDVSIARDAVETVTDLVPNVEDNQCILQSAVLEQLQLDSSSNAEEEEEEDNALDPFLKAANQTLCITEASPLPHQPIGDVVKVHETTDIEQNFSVQKTRPMAQEYPSYDFSLQATVTESLPVSSTPRVHHAHHKDTEEHENHPTDVLREELQQQEEEQEEVDFQTANVLENKKTQISHLGEESVKRYFESGDTEAHFPVGASDFNLQYEEVPLSEFMSDAAGIGEASPCEINEEVSVASVIVEPGSCNLSDVEDDAELDQDVEEAPDLEHYMEQFKPNHDFSDVTSNIQAIQEALLGAIRPLVDLPDSEEIEAVSSLVEPQPRDRGFESTEVTVWNRPFLETFSAVESYVMTEQPGQLGQTPDLTPEIKYQHELEFPKAPNQTQWFPKTSAVPNERVDEPKLKETSFIEKTPPVERTHLLEEHWAADSNVTDDPPAGNGTQHDLTRLEYVEDDEQTSGCETHVLLAEGTDDIALAEPIITQEQLNRIVGMVEENVRRFLEANAATLQASADDAGLAERCLPEGEEDGAGPCVQPEGGEMVPTAQLEDAHGDELAEKTNFESSAFIPPLKLSDFETPWDAVAASSCTQGTRDLDASADVIQPARLLLASVAPAVSTDDGAVTPELESVDQWLLETPPLSRRRPASRINEGRLDEDGVPQSPVEQHLTEEVKRVGEDVPVVGKRDEDVWDNDEDDGVDLHFENQELDKDLEPRVVYEKLNKDVDSFEEDKEKQYPEINVVHLQLEEEKVDLKREQEVSTGTICLHSDPQVQLQSGSVSGSVLVEPEVEVLPVCDEIEAVGVKRYVVEAGCDYILNAQDTVADESLFEEAQVSQRPLNEVPMSKREIYDLATKVDLDSACDPSKSFGEEEQLRETRLLTEVGEIRDILQSMLVEVNQPVERFTLRDSAEGKDALTSIIEECGETKGMVGNALRGITDASPEEEPRATEGSPLLEGDRHSSRHSRPDSSHAAQGLGDPEGCPGAATDGGGGDESAEQPLPDANKARPKPRRPRPAFPTVIVNEVIPEEDESRAFVEDDDSPPGASGWDHVAVEPSGGGEVRPRRGWAVSATAVADASPSYKRLQQVFEKVLYFLAFVVFLVALYHYDIVVCCALYVVSLGVLYYENEITESGHRQYQPRE